MKHLLPFNFIPQSVKPSSNKFPPDMESHKRMPLKRLLVMACIALTFSCNTSNKAIVADPVFSRYIEAYTSGTVSKKNTIRVQLAEGASVTHAVNETVKETLFELKPAVAGKAYWTDTRTLEFKN